MNHSTLIVSLLITLNVTAQVPLNRAKPQAEEQTGSSAIPYAVVEEKPLFEGGDVLTFYKWVMDNVNCPETVRKTGVQGKVIASFEISGSGKVRNVNAVHNLNRALEDEVVRVIKESPDWTPGKQKGDTVSTIMTLPLSFDIKKNKK